MSRENVDLVREIFEAWLRGDPALDRFDPDISMVESSALPGAVSAHGLDEVRRYIEGFSKHWDDIRFEPQEYLDAGDRVVVVARLIGRGRSSGVAVEREWAYVWTVRDGRALRMDGYADRAEALRVAGLDPDQRGAQPDR
jgi:ketosteroid isomerase-like protein